MGGIGEMLNLASYAMMGLLPSMWAFMFVPILVYVVARYRMIKESMPEDAQLGLKLTLARCAYAAYQLLLLGLCLLVYTLLTDKERDTRTDLLRTSAGIVVPVALLLMVSLGVFMKTNRRNHPLIGRMYVGVNRLHVFALFAVSLFVQFQALFQRSTNAELAAIGWALVLVYFAAAALEGLRVKDILKPRVASVTKTVTSPPAAR